MFTADIKGASNEFIDAGQDRVQRSAAGLAQRLAALAELAYPDLRAEWRRLYRAHPPKKVGRDVLELGIA